MEKYHGHTLDYWKSNAEEDYIKTPISVLQYITCLEEHIEQLTIPAVSESFSKSDLLDLGGWFDGSPEFVEEVVSDWLNAR